jgi:hypothetical protein
LVSVTVQCPTGFPVTGLVTLMMAGWVLKRFDGAAGAIQHSMSWMVATQRIFRDTTASSATG